MIYAVQVVQIYYICYKNNGKGRIGTIKTVTLYIKFVYLYLWQANKMQIGVMIICAWPCNNNFYYQAKGGNRFYCHNVYCLQYDVLQLSMKRSVIIVFFTYLVSLIFVPNITTKFYECALLIRHTNNICHISYWYIFSNNYIKWVYITCVLFY